MKITKYIHSCLVFEQDGFKILVDPGNYTFADGRLKPEDFADVSAIFISHIHADHLDADNLKSIIALSKATVYTNKQVAETLDKQGIKTELFTDGHRVFGGMEFIAMPVFHMPLLGNPTPEMTGYIINGKILHPVDSMHTILTEMKDIDLLILPIIAPFCNELQVAAFGEALRPKHILPVHDGYVKEVFAKGRQANYVKYFANVGVTVLQAPAVTLPDGTEVVFKFDH